MIVNTDGWSEHVVLTKAVCCKQQLCVVQEHLRLMRFYIIDVYHDGPLVVATVKVYTVSIFAEFERRYQIHLTAILLSLHSLIHGVHQVVRKTSLTCVRLQSKEVYYRELLCL